MSSDVAKADEYSSRGEEFAATKCECGAPADDISFDRSICACGRMHYYCRQCGAQADACDDAPESASRYDSPEAWVSGGHEKFETPVIPVRDEEHPALKCPRGCVDTDGCGCAWNVERERSDA